MTTKRLLTSIGIVLVLSILGYWGYLQFLAPVNGNVGDTAVSAAEVGVASADAEAELALLQAGTQAEQLTVAQAEITVA